MLGDLELRETKSSKGAGLGVRLEVVSRGADEYGGKSQ